MYFIDFVVMYSSPNYPGHLVGPHMHDFKRFVKRSGLILVILVLGGGRDSAARRADYRIFGHLGPDKHP